MSVAHIVGNGAYQNGWTDRGRFQHGGFLLSIPVRRVIKNRSGSRILQGRVSNPSESGTAPPIILTYVNGTKQFFGIRRNSWHQAVVRHLELYQIPDEAPCSAKNCNDMFSKYVFFQKRAPKQKGGCLDTLVTPLDPPLKNWVSLKTRAANFPLEICPQTLDLENFAISRSCCKRNSSMVELS